MYAQAHHSTLMLENMFNTARRAAKSNERGRLEAKGVWHATALADTTCRDFDRPTIPTAHASISRGKQQRLLNSFFQPSQAGVPQTT